MTISVIVPVSPIASHPSTHIIEETVASVRHHLPDAEIILTFDGVRAEQQHMRGAYEEATRRTLWLSRQWGAVCPFVWDSHLHQVGMFRKIIATIETELLLFVEQDTPLEPEHIDWQACIDHITSGEADVVRYSHESSILPEHKHLARERKGDFVRTLQYSARPHLASVAYYRRVLDECFSPDANTFLEEPLHGAAQVNPDEHKIWMYHPEGNIRRSRHLDGRAGEDKYEDQLRF